jgi:hypothetical protein
MNSPFRPFQRSQIYTQCEECRISVDLTGAGACTQCRRILCGEHLHGSVFRRLAVDLGAEALCLRCRSGIPAE